MEHEHNKEEPVTAEVVKASDLFVRCLETEGVEFVFGVPGEENLDLLESLRTSSVRLVLTRHEQAAAFMASTIGRLTGKAGVCLSTLGPGATNLVTGAAYAQLGAMPMLMITGQKPIRKSKQGRFQIIDTVSMMNPITKFSAQIVSLTMVPSLIRESFRVAEEERPGAVHLELPEDIAAERIQCFHGPFQRDRVRRPVTDDKAIDWAVDMLEKARKPLLLIGAASNRKLTRKMLTAFVEKTGIFFFDTQMGKGVIDERSPHFLGTASLSNNDFIHAAISKADLIVNVGHDVIEKPPFFMETPEERARRGEEGEPTRVIHINFTGAKVDEVYFPQVEVVGDIANAIWRIMEKINIEQTKKWDNSYYQVIKAKLAATISAGEKMDEFPLDPRRIVCDTRSIVPDDGIVCLDNGLYKIWFTRNYDARNINTLLVDNALATMGAGLPSAIASCLVHPDRKVLAVCGDGGFMMNSQELETAVRLKLRLVVVILNDSAYGMIKWKQAAAGLPDFGLDYTNPDFVKYADAYGAKGHRITATHEFAPKLKECLYSKDGGVHLIEVPINYGASNDFLNKELKELYKQL